MRKKALICCIISFSLIMICACSRVTNEAELVSDVLYPSATAATDDDSVSEIELEEDSSDHYNEMPAQDYVAEDIADIELKWSSFTLETKDRFNFGYQLRQEYIFSPWIPGTRMDIVNAYWSEVGYGPLIDVSEGYDYFGDALSNYHDDELFYMIGTVAVENITEGFAIDGGDRVHSQLYYGLCNADDQEISLDLKVGYQTGEGTCDAFTNYQGHIQDVKKTMMPEAVLSSDKWGPVPCIYVLINQKTPNTPNGPHDISGLYFDIGNKHHQDWASYTKAVIPYYLEDGNLVMQ